MKDARDQLAANHQSLQGKEEAAAAKVDEQRIGAEAEHGSLQERRIRMKEEVSALETARKSIEEEVREADMLREASESQLVCAKQELADASLAVNETQKNREHA